MQGELDNICRRLIEEALEGNIQAMRLILDRILPPRKDRSIEINVPTLKTPDDALKAISVISQAIGSGDITPCEGESLSRIIDIFVKAINTYNLEKRLNELEAKVIQ